MTTYNIPDPHEPIVHRFTDRDGDLVRLPDVPVFDFHDTDRCDLVELLDELTAVWPEDGPPCVRCEIAALRAELHERFGSAA